MEHERSNKILHEKVRKLEDKTKPPKELKPELQNVKAINLTKPKITEDDIKKLEQRIKVLTEKKGDAEKNYLTEEKEGERRKKELMEEQAKLQKVIKEKEMV